MDDIFSSLFGEEHETTANYHVSCSVLRNMFYVVSFDEKIFVEDKEIGKKLLYLALKFCIEKGIEIPKEYLDLPVTFISNADGSKVGYVIEFNDVKYECDCNFVAMMMVNGDRKYYTSEYYEYSKTFSLCSFSANGDHASYSDKIASFEDFKNAVLK